MIRIVEREGHIPKRKYIYMKGKTKEKKNKKGKR